MILTAKAKHRKKNLFQCYFVERERESERERERVVRRSVRVDEERVKPREQREREREIERDRVTSNLWGGGKSVPFVCWVWPAHPCRGSDVKVKTPEC